MVVEELVQLAPEEAFATITSLIVADVDKTKLAALFGDCADAANTRGNRENERMFLLAELVTGGTFPTNGNVDEIRSRANLMLALHEQQKALPRIAESPSNAESMAAEINSPELPNAAATHSDAPAAVVVAPEIAPAESPTASPAEAAPEPQVRRRTRKKK